MPSEPIRRASSDEEQIASAEDQGSVQDAAEPAAPADAGVIAGQEDADTAEHTIVEPGETEDAGDNVLSTSGPRTIPLPEISARPLAALEMGTTIGDRYEVVGLLSAGQDTNVYRAIDKQGHLRCWACGSSSSMSGDVYCVECGAQLAGRYYRLQEFMLEAD